MLFYILVFLIACFSGFFQALSGFGYSVVSMTTLPLMMSPLSATTISGVVGNLQSMVLSWKMRHHIRFSVMIIPLVASVLFAWGSITVMAQRPVTQYKQALGIFLIVIAFYLLFFNDRIKIKANWLSGLLTGAVSGVANGLFGMGGPPAVMYTMAATKSKEEYLSTIQFFFLLSGLSNTVIRIFNGALTPEVLKLCAVSIVGMMLGGYVGSKIFRKLSQKQMGRFVYGFMMIMGIVITVKG